MQESAGKKVNVVRTCHEKGGRIRGERVMRMGVQGRRRKGRLKQRWMDSVNVDVSEKGLPGGGGGGGGEDTKPGCVEATCHIHRPNIEVGKDAEEEEEDP